MNPFRTICTIDPLAILARFTPWYDLELLALRAGEAERQRKRAAHNMRRYGLKPAA